MDKEDLVKIDKMLDQLLGMAKDKGLSESIVNKMNRQKEMVSYAIELKNDEVTDRKTLLAKLLDRDVPKVLDMVKDVLNEFGPDVAVDYASNLFSNSVAKTLMGFHAGNKDDDEKMASERGITMCDEMSKALKIAIDETFRKLSEIEDIKEEHENVCKDCSTHH